MERNELIKAVTRAQSGDSDAIGDLYNAFYQSVYYFAKKTVHDDDLALDITQETFMEVIRTIGSLKAPEAFSTWLRQITYHQCTRYFKKNKEVLFEEDEEGNSILDTIADESEGSVPEEVYEKAEFKEIILTMIDSLTPEQRAVVVLYYFDELPVKKIAEIQGVSEGTIKSRLNYARRTLREGVETYEKKTGTKLHAIPFLPLFRLFLNTPAQMGEADAAAIGKAVSAAATGGALAAGAAGTTATAAAATSATATAATAATATTAATAAVAGSAVAATTAAAVTIPLSVKIIAAIAAVAITFGAGTAIVKKASESKAPAASETQVMETEDEPSITESEYEEVLSPGIGSESDTSITNPDAPAFESSTSGSDITEPGTGITSPTDEPTENETVADTPVIETAEAETEPVIEDSDNVQYVPTCIRTHVKPTVTIDGDTITITNHTFEFDESNICFDDLTILIDGVDIYVNGLSERVDLGGPIVNYIRVEDSVSFSLAPYASAGNHTVTVKTACISADANHTCDHWKEIGDVVVTLEYHKSGEPETDVAVEVPEETTPDNDLPMGDLCTKTHVAPTLSIDVDMLTITNNTEGSDDFIILIDEVIVERLFAVSESVTLDLSGYTTDGAHLVTVMSRCECDQIYYDAPNPTCDPFSSTSTIVYFYGGELPMGNPPCTLTHVSPTLQLEGTSLTITNHSWSLEVSNVLPDRFYIFINGERLSDIVSVSNKPVTVELAPFVKKAGTYTLTVMSKCRYKLENGETVDESCDPTYASTTIEFYYEGRGGSDSSGEPETEEVVVSPDFSGGDDLPMGEACTSIHMPPAIEITGTTLKITNYTWSLNESNIQPDKYYVFVNGEIVEGPLNIFSAPLYVELDEYIKEEGTYTITVMSRCQYRYENGEMTNVQCDPFVSSSTLEYYFNGIVEEPAVDVPAEPPVEVVPEY